MKRLAGVLALLCGIASAATAQTAAARRGDRGTVSLRASIGVFAPVSPLVAFENGTDADLDLQAGSAFGLELNWMIADGFGLYAGSTGLISRVNHSTALLTEGPSRTTSQVTVLLPSGGFILAPRIGRLGFRPMLRLGAGVKFYDFELTEVTNGVRGFTGDLGIGLSGGLGPVSFVSEARWILSEFDPAVLPVPVPSGPKQRQNDWLLMMGFRYSLAARAPATVPAPAGAQEPRARAAAHREGSIELTAGAGLFFVDQALNAFLGQATPKRFMVGGEVRAAYNFSRHVGLSLGTARGSGGGTLLIAPFGALTCTFDLNRKFSPFIEVGGGLTRFGANTGALFGGAGDSATAAFSAFGGLGVRAMLGERLALRVAGRMAYAKYNALDNGTVTLGLSYFLGGGSPHDTDAAGVPDRRDRFADTPADVTVLASGGPVLRDTDNDGVTDDLDRCADTPADARPVDAGGCPVPRDTDGDGVSDTGDRCPDTPAGTPVDATGCPPAEPAEQPTLWALPEVGQSLVLSAVQFAAAGSGLTAASRTVLDYVAAAIRAIPNSRWEVGGYTSSTGTRADNLRLSQARARSVVRYLVSRGVTARALRAVGYGPARPVAPNSTAVGRAQNRRVEIKRTR